VSTLYWCSGGRPSIDAGVDVHKMQFLPPCCNAPVATTLSLLYTVHAVASATGSRCAFVASVFFQVSVMYLLPSSVF